MNKSLLKRFLILVTVMLIVIMIFTVKSNAEEIITEEHIAISKYDLLTGETSIIEVSTKDEGRKSTCLCSRG